MLPIIQSSIVQAMPASTPANLRLGPSLSSFPPLRASARPGGGGVLVLWDLDNVRPPTREWPRVAKTLQDAAHTLLITTTDTRHEARVPFPVVLPDLIPAPAQNPESPAVRLWVYCNEDCAGATDAAHAMEAMRASGWEWRVVSSMRDRVDAEIRTDLYHVFTRTEEGGEKPPKPRPPPPPLPKWVVLVSGDGGFEKDVRWVRQQGQGGIRVVGVVDGARESRARKKVERAVDVVGILEWR